MYIVMKSKIIYLMLTALVLFLSGCDKESKLSPTDDLGIVDMFSPGEDADPRVKTMYSDYGVWVRTYFNSVEELTNGILAQDALVAMRGAQNLEEEKIPEVLYYSEALLSNVSEEYAKSFFPLEIFYVKQYGSLYWIYPVKALGRSRLILMWPNTSEGAIPVEDPVNHYYRDSVLASEVWRKVGTMIVARMEEPLKDFVAGGKAYDDGVAYEKLGDEYDKDKKAWKEENPDANDDDEEEVKNRPYEVKYRNAVAELCRNGGYITGGSSRSFEGDFSEWLRLLVTESYDNIKKEYLDNSKPRALKYEIIIKYFKEYGWDIQAAGNRFRQRFDGYKYL